MDIIEVESLMQSVEFDSGTLSPTYRLLIGVPGRSNAFEISKRLGLHESVITKAPIFVGTDTHQVENMIAGLEESKRQAEKELEEAHDLLKNAEKLQKDLQQQMIEYYDQKDSLYRESSK